jgi:hypothetical protein
MVRRLALTFAVLLSSVAVLFVPGSADAHREGGRGRWGSPVAVQQVSVVAPALANDGTLTSRDFDGDYFAARAGTGAEGVFARTDLAAVTVGQTYAGAVFETFLAWDVSGAPVGAVSAELALWLASDQTAEDFTVEVRLYDWGATLTPADWIPGADIAALPLLATLDTAAIYPEGEYKTFATTAALLTAIADAQAGDGVLRVVVVSSRTTQGVPWSRTQDYPAGVPEALAFASADDAPHAPLLTVNGP